MVKRANEVTRILYIEDDRELQVLMTLLLEELGYEVECAYNGKLGVEKAESWQPDLILTDVRMPVMDGPQAIRHLRDKSDTAEIPIFVLSAYTDAKTRDLCKQAGANEFFAKPPNIDKIHSAITEILKAQ